MWWRKIIGCLFLALFVGIALLGLGVIMAADNDMPDWTDLEEDE